MTLQLYFHDRMVEHDPGHTHPERPDRLRVLRRRLGELALPGVSWREPGKVDREVVERVHRGGYVDEILAYRGQSAFIDVDTRVSPASIDAAELAAGACCEAVEAVIEADADRAFSLVRPPGHHAESARAMGFCLFNNIAIAARFALDNFDDINRVQIFDWDVHHGNGTQEIFYDDDDVLYVSIHEHPFFPGTGALDEMGKGPGEGMTVNVPFGPEMSDGDYRLAFDRVVRPIGRQFEPDLILVSAGFDAHLLDPLARMDVTSEGFAGLCGMVDDLAEEVADGRLALVLEGGYHLDGLAESAEGCAEVLAGGEAPTIGAEPSDRGKNVLERVVQAQAEYWSILGD